MPAASRPPRPLGLRSQDEDQHYAEAPGQPIEDRIHEIAAALLPSSGCIIAGDTTKIMTKSKLLRMDNVGIVVESLDDAISFLAELGLTLEGRAMVFEVHTLEQDSDSRQLAITEVQHGYGVSRAVAG